MPVYVSDLLTATAAPVNAVPTATRTWQWLRGSTAISGATSSTYTAVADDIGATIAASQIETNVAGTATATSAPTEIIQAFDPIRLFSASEPGVWYDPNDITTLFKGPTPVAPVTTPGDSVYFMMDKSQGGPGPELVTNGDFETALGAEWVAYRSVISIVSNKLRVESNEVQTTNFASQSFAVETGKVYRFTADISNVTAIAARLFVGPTDRSTTWGATGNITSDGTYELIFTATGTTAYISLVLTSAVDASVEHADFDNISVKELPGNHATQPTTASQPIYGIVPAGGRRNLLTYSEDFRNTAAAGEVRPWAYPNAAITPNADGVAELVYPLTSGTVRGIERVLGPVTSSQYTVSIEAKAAGLNFLYLYGAQGNSVAYFNLTTGAVGTVGSGLTAAISGPDAGGYYRCAVTQTVTYLNFAAGGCDANGSTQATASGTNGVLLRNAQLEQSATATPYQRVTTQYDVTEAGVASLGYLFFDGSGDFMSTGTITPGTDKAQVFAGVRKLSDALQGVVLELSASGATNSGIISVFAPITAGQPNYDFGSKGTIFTGATGTGFAAPVTNVLTGLGDISGDLATLRIDGTQAAQNTANQGTGDYLAYPLYIGRRNATTNLYFNGQLFPLIVRFGPNLTTARISATESWVASKTAGVTL